MVLSRITFDQLRSRPGKGFSKSGEFAIVTTARAARNSTAAIVYSSSNGGLYYNANRAVSGWGSGGQFATLTQTPAIAASDFILQ